MTSSLVSNLEIASDPRTPVNGQQDFDFGRLPPFRIKPGMSRQDIGQCLEAIDHACQAAPEDAISDEVAALKARTKSRAQDPAEAAFAAELMVHDLAQYPIDVARFACQRWIEGGADAKWFPSWPELREICERRIEPRKRLQRALVNAMRDSIGQSEP